MILSTFGPSKLSLVPFVLGHNGISLRLIMTSSPTRNAVSPCNTRRSVRPASKSARCVRRFLEFIDTMKVAAASSRYNTINFIAANSVDKEVKTMSS